MTTVSRTGIAVLRRLAVADRVVARCVTAVTCRTVLPPGRGALPKAAKSWRADEVRRAALRIASTSSGPRTVHALRRRTGDRAVAAHDEVAVGALDCVATRIERLALRRRRREPRDPRGALR